MKGLTADAKSLEGHHLDVLNAELQDLIGGRAGEVDVDA